MAVNAAKFLLMVKLKYQKGEIQVKERFKIEVCQVFDALKNSYNYKREKVKKLKVCYLKAILRINLNYFYLVN